MKNKSICILAGILSALAGIMLFAYSYFSGWGQIPPGSINVSAAWFTGVNVKAEVRRYRAPIADLRNFYSLRGYTVQDIARTLYFDGSNYRIGPLEFSRRFSLEISDLSTDPPLTTLRFYSSVFWHGPNGRYPER